MSLIKSLALVGSCLFVMSCAHHHGHHGDKGCCKDKMEMACCKKGEGHGEKCKDDGKCMHEEKKDTTSKKP